MSSTSFVILSAESPPAGGESPLAPLGSRRDLLRDLAAFNTGPERETAGQDEDVLFGPGIRIELQPGQDPITQMLLTLTEQEIGWLVLPRLAKHFGWRILDTNTGRELAFTRAET